MDTTTRTTTTFYMSTTGWAPRRATSPSPASFLHSTPADSPAIRYLILDILGQGTFGQVVKCQNMKTHEIVAVKVVKNKPAYFNQSMMEVTILELLNKNFDPNDEHHILRLRDSFIHRNHLCLVFELLSSNLYELIKQNQFQGLSTQLVKVFMAQLLDALTVLKDARLIHCDLKPENILLKSQVLLQSPQIKVIDFGSACHERQTVYTYIQSRFYRSPEVLLGMSYTSAIDMWSLGCIAVELFLGLPLFPGTSEYNQLTRIIEMLGMPPMSMLNTGKQVSQFFDSFEVWNSHANQNERKYKLKSMEQYSREHGTNGAAGEAVKPSRNSGNEVEKEMANRAAFIDFCQGLLTLNPVTRWTPQQARMHPFITGEKFTKPFVPDNPIMVSHHIQPGQVADPKRPYGGLVPSQPKGQRAYYDAAAYNHQLAQHQAYANQAATQAANTTRNPYMVTHQPPQNHQQLPPQQHGGHSSQAQAPPPPPQPQQSSASQYQPPQDVSMVGVGVNALGGYQSQQMHSHSGYGGGGPGPQGRQPPLQHQSSAGQLGGQGGQYGAPPTAPGAPPQAHLSPGSGSSAGSGGSGGAASRARANTINQMDAVPPALARLQHMNQDVIGGRNALTPVLNRDDAMREWERRQQGGKPAQVPAYPQLEYLQQQAEMAVTSGMAGNAWATVGPAVGAALGIHPTAHGGIALNHGGHRYPPPQPSKLSHSYHPPPTAGSTSGGGPGPGILVDDNSTTGVGPPSGGGNGNPGASARRDAIISNVRSAARGDGGPAPGQNSHQPQTPSGGGSMYGGGGGGGPIQLSSSMSISSPPQAYTGNMTVTGNRYAATYGGPPSAGGQGQQQQQQQNSQQQQNQNSSSGGAPSSAGGVFDSIERRSDLGSMFVPMQPDNYHPQQQQPQGSQASQYVGASQGGGGPRAPQQAVPTSFYGAGVVPSGGPPPPSSASQGPQVGQGAGQRNPFSNMPVPDPSAGMVGVGVAGVGIGIGGMGGMQQQKQQDVRRGNGLDAWPR
ncbi:hypothetical protein NP233_g6268 [Leucocoprinus birnbaumii]|uniref:Protein kinase domain-containing protein n=1 Tax=Leucocoprinus birnbaumii TaxID=56174 RepID=A0AAD5VWW5_9AGAR|nr:hypothetical protein NP233_g6268 [Leucocoprinus birnbaumii]